MADRDVDQHPLGMCADGSMGLVEAIEMATMFPMDRRLADNMRLVGGRARALSARLADVTDDLGASHETAAHWEVRAKAAEARLAEAEARVAAAYEEAALWLDQEGFDGDYIRALVPDAKRDALARIRAEKRERWAKVADEMAKLLERAWTENSDLGHEWDHATENALASYSAIREDGT